MFFSERPNEIELFNYYLMHGDTPQEHLCFVVSVMDYTVGVVKVNSNKPLKLEESTVHVVSKYSLMVAGKTWKSNCLARVLRQHGIDILANLDKANEILSRRLIQGYLIYTYYKYKYLQQWLEYWVEKTGDKSYSVSKYVDKCMRLSVPELSKRVNPVVDLDFTLGEYTLQEYKELIKYLK